MDWDVKFNGVSIKEKVSSVRVRRPEGSFCHEVDVDLIDTTLYHSIDWTLIPETPQIEVLANLTSGWETMGMFFVERPVYSVDPDVRGLKGIWGRSSVAVLAEPFARTFTKTWTQAISLFDLIGEVIDGSGVELSLAKTTIPNFLIPPLAYSADKALPVDIISELAEICGAVLLGDVYGDIYLTQIDYAPATAVHIISDIDIKEYSEELIFPEFANRVLVSADNASSGYDLDVFAETQCLSVDSGIKVPVYARISDDDGGGVNDVPVDWSTTTGLLTLERATSNTGLFPVTETVQSDGYYAVELKYPPQQVLSALNKDGKSVLGSGCTIDGTRVTFGAKLTYCDETITVRYESSGIAVNSMLAGDNYGNDTVIASVAGAKDTEEIYIGNPCQCSEMDGGPGDGGPGSTYGLTITASPDAIDPVTTDAYGQDVCSSVIKGCISQLLITADEYAPITDGRLLTVKEITAPEPLGELEWETGSIGMVEAENIPGEVSEDTEYTVKVVVNAYLDSVSKVEYRSAEAVALNPETPWTDISNDVTDFDGRNITIDRNFTDIKGGDEVRIAGEISSAATNMFTGKKCGTATIQATMQGSKEEPMVATCEILICEEGGGGDGGGGGGEDPPPPKPPAWDPTKPTNCKLADGSVVKCPKGQGCCDKAGVRGCYPVNECDSQPDECYTTHCQANPTSECITTRFKAGLDSGGGCSCFEMCDKELSKYGTTQSYDGSSYRDLVTIVEEDHGLTQGTPAFQEKFAELKKSAMKSCEDECDKCEPLGAVSVSGPDAVTAPGGYQYTASGGNGQYVWTVSGSGGVSIDETGFVTLEAGACGSYQVLVGGVGEACAGGANMFVRITNAGQWVLVSEIGGSSSSCYSMGSENCIKGKYMLSSSWTRFASQDYCNSPAWPDCDCRGTTTLCGTALAPDQFGAQSYVYYEATREWEC